MLNIIIAGSVSVIKETLSAQIMREKSHSIHISTSSCGRIAKYNVYLTIRNNTDRVKLSAAI